MRRQNTILSGQSETLKTFHHRGTENAEKTLLLLLRRRRSNNRNLRALCASVVNKLLAMISNVSKWPVADIKKPQEFAVFLETLGLKKSILKRYPSHQNF